MKRQNNELRDWLASIGLEQHAESFERDDLDLDLLPHLTDQDLEKLGLSLGHRKRLLLALGQLGKLPTSTQGASLNLNQAAVEVLIPGVSIPGLERRQLTVLFCDLVGSTALSERLDPEDLRSLMQAYQQACRTVIERYEGHIAQYLGDGLMVYFGWPRAHEDDAERAVRTALEILPAVKQVEAPSPLRVHLGIATGPVVVGGAEGEDPAAPKLAVGETPNIAARLQGLAGPDEIVIGPSTRQLAGGAFEYTDLGEHSLKGIAEALRSWRVNSVSQAEGRFEATRAARHTPLVGREQEIRLLMQRWEQAKGGEGQVVLLCGEAGIGKSRIANALLESGAPHAHYRLRYHCSPYHVNSAYYPIIEQVRRAANIGAEDDSSTKLAKLEALMSTARAANPRSVPLIAALLGIPLGDKYPPLDLPPRKRKEETIKVLQAAMVGPARQAPVLVLLEDAHWLDPSSLEAFNQLVLLAQSHHVLMLITFRPEFSPKWVDQRHVTLLSLNRLGKHHTAELVGRVAGGKPLPEEVLEQIAAKTDGVPLFVEELTKSVLESGLVKEERDRYSLSAPLPALAIPATLRDSLSARLDRLAPVKQIAQIGACIGREFDYELMSLVSPIAAPKLDEALSELTASELVFQRGTPPKATYVFKHALVQDAAYESLLKSRRAQLHAQIGRAIEERYPEITAAQPELLAHHFTAAHLLEDAIGYWHQAGELALKRVAVTEAIAHLDGGMKLVQQLPASRGRDVLELDLRATLAAARIALHGWAHPKVAENLEPAWRLTQALDRDEHSLRILWGLWIFQMCIGHVRESLSWSEQLLAEAARKDRMDLRLAGHWAATNTHCYLGEYHPTLEHADAILRHYDAARDRYIADLLNYDPKTLALNYTAFAQCFLGFPDRAAKTSEDCLAHARMRGHAVDVSWALYMNAVVHAFRGDPMLSALKVDELERHARAQGLPFYYDVLGPLSRAWCLSMHGQAREAEVLFREGLPRRTAAGLAVALPMYRALHGQSAALLGQLDVALEELDAALEQIGRPDWDERFFLPEALRLKGWVLQLKGDVPGAEAQLRSAIGVAQQQEAKWWELRAATSLARLLKEHGRRSEGLELLAPVYAWFTEGFDTRDLQESRGLLEELAGEKLRDRRSEQ